METEEGGMTVLLHVGLVGEDSVMCMAGLTCRGFQSDQVLEAYCSEVGTQAGGRALPRWK